MACLLLAVLLLLAAHPALGEGTPQRQMTLMIYMCGSDLESLHGVASAELQYLLATDYDAEKVDVLIMTGGAREWHNRLFSGTTEIHCIRHPHLIRMHGLTIRQMSASSYMPWLETVWFDSARSMGDPETLASFLRYGVENHPAAEYGLLVWSAWSSPSAGVCQDELFDGDALTPDELEAALRDGGFSEDNRLALVGFDASLMGNLQIAMRLAPFARCMIADEGLMPGVVSLSTRLLQALGEGLTGEAAAISAVSRYVELSVGEGIPVAAACVDLGAVGAVDRARNALFDAVKAQNPAWTANIVTRMLMDADLDNPLRIWQSYGVFDLRLLAEQCAPLAPEEAAALNAALDGAVLFSGGDVSGAAGLSTCP